ncbi:MAG TPA: DinB family protein [bacterium]|nr:DinB family protein [bacterium]
MALHEVHHRSQVMAMLRRCGVRAETLDDSFLAFERTPLNR